ncbi:biopolymer transporter ExbD [Marinobacter pelagius]|uniref:ExbD/TolR family protein n=1 Tax=Marinobacter sp. C7 TaxID=2951363 RepID=UPI001EF0F48C|nr:biopolymer transporter ExbD [Marinobacter sp. C7]MCG7200472.1 biopolymer transporter ExbD [Marinobacter sp. C7]
MQLVEPRPGRPIPIRITPLIDVVFILLVFFMLTSRLLPVGALELANDTSDRNGASGDPLPALTILSGGNVRWKEQTLRPDELAAALDRQGIGEVNLSTEGNTQLSSFTRILSLLDQQGVTTHWKRTEPKQP